MSQKEQIVKIPNDNIWHQKTQIEEIQKFSREIKNLYLDSKLMRQTLDAMTQPFL